MSLFSIFNGTKNGAGVAKDDREKKPFFKFWEIFFRKFWSLSFLNIIFLMWMLPFAALSVGIFFFLKASAWSITDNIQLSVIMILLPFAFCGPFIAATQKITRDFSREIPVFAWSDFFGCIKKNFVQPLVMSIIGYVVFSLLSVAMPFYYYSDLGFVRYILFGICILVFILFLFMQYYLYTMAVTFDLSIKQLYKNAFILSTVTLVRNLIITAVLALYVILFVVVLLNTPVFNFFFPLMLMFFVIIGFSLFSFTVSFVTFPSLKKYIIEPYYKENPGEVFDERNAEDDREDDEEKNGIDDSDGVTDGLSGNDKINGEIDRKKDEDATQETAVDSSSDTNKKEPSKPEYVYHNGRMVPRSVLENEKLFSDDVKNK